MVCPGAAAVSRGQAVPVLNLLLWHHPELCSGKTLAAAGTEQHHLSGLGLTCAYLLKPQEGLWRLPGSTHLIFKQGRMCGFTTHRALSLPTASGTQQARLKWKQGFTY